MITIKRGDYLRNSKQRDLILKIINNSNNHPTAIEIYTIARSFIKNISLGTIYRNINLLENQGKIKRIKMKDNIDRFDNCLSKHAHFICINCSKIIDIENEFLNGYSNICGNKVLDLEVNFKGICSDCLKERER